MEAQSLILKPQESRAADKLMKFKLAYIYTDQA